MTVAALFLLAGSLLAVMVVGFAAWQDFIPEKLLHYGHYFEMLAIAVVFVFILIPNIVRMWLLTIYKQKIKIPISA